MKNNRVADTKIMENYSDIKERSKVIKLFAAIGFLATFTMGCLAAINHEYHLVITLFFSAAFFASPFCIKNHALASTIVLYTLYGLMIYLVLTGGSQGTGPIWIFIVSSVTFFIQGLKRGIVDIIIFISTVIIAFYLASHLKLHTYTPEALPLRIIASFIVVALLSGVYEYFRESYSKKIIALAKKNELLATTDSLTELPNRRYTIEQLKQEKIRMQRSKNAMSILLCDVDDFKKINDEYGHHVGDQALIHLAHIFQQSIREQDIIARWGGEEFLFMLPNTSKENAQLLAEKIHQKLAENPLKINNEIIKITISGGITEALNSRTLELDIQQADKYLYQAKSSGKNRTCLSPLEKTNGNKP